MSMSTSTAPIKANHETNESRDGINWLAYFFLGICFGITLTQSEVLSWFRIQEMFRFQSPRMYEIIASAIVVAAVSVALIKRLGVRTISGEPIVIPPKTMGLGVRYAAGGTIFGLAGHLSEFARDRCSRSLGSGVSVMIVGHTSARWPEPGFTDY